MKEKTYSYDEAFEAALQYFNGDELAARVWVNKYSMKDSYGHIYEVSPEDMHWRIANEIARIENKYENPLKAEEIFGLLDHFKIHHPGRQSHDRNRQQPPNRIALQLLRHRSGRTSRLIRRHHPHRRRTGATDETARRRRP